MPTLYQSILQKSSYKIAMCIVKTVSENSECMSVILCNGEFLSKGIPAHSPEGRRLSILSPNSSMISGVIATDCETRLVVGATFSFWRYGDALCIGNESRGLGHRPYSENKWKTHLLEGEFVLSKFQQCYSCCYIYISFQKSSTFIPRV